LKTTTFDVSEDILKQCGEKMTQQDVYIVTGIKYATQGASRQKGEHRSLSWVLTEQGEEDPKGGIDWPFVFAYQISEIGTNKLGKLENRGTVEWRDVYELKRVIEPARKAQTAEKEKLQVDVEEREVREKAL
jgi:hypothetical protein